MAGAHWPSSGLERSLGVKMPSGGAGGVSLPAWPDRNRRWSTVPSPGAQPRKSGTGPPVTSEQGQPSSARPRHHPSAGQTLTSTSRFVLAPGINRSPERHLPDHLPALT
jgi:hypothetical protein